MVLVRKVISNSGDRDGVGPEIKRLVPNAETQIASMLIAQLGLVRRKNGQVEDRLLIPMGGGREVGKEKVVGNRPILRVWIQKNWTPKMKKCRRAKSI